MDVDRKNRIVYAEMRSYIEGVIFESHIVTRYSSVFSSTGFQPRQTVRTWFHALRHIIEQRNQSVIILIREQKLLLIMPLGFDFLYSHCSSLLASERFVFAN